MSHPNSMFPEHKITPWNKNPSIAQTFQAGNIEIVVLTQATLNEVKELVQRNKADDGFMQMSEEVLSGKKFDEIVSGKSRDKCFLAKQSMTGKLIGFVVTGENAEEKFGVIDSLGVDRTFRHGVAESKEKNKPQQVGASLLLVAVNELFQNSAIKKVGVVISDDTAADFYRKFKFQEGSDDSDELYLTKKNVSFLEGYLVQKGQLTQLQTKASSAVSPQGPSMGNKSSGSE